MKLKFLWQNSSQGRHAIATAAHLAALVAKPGVASNAGSRSCTSHGDATAPGVTRQIHKDVSDATEDRHTQQR